LDLTLMSSLMDRAVSSLLGAALMSSLMDCPVSSLLDPTLMSSLMDRSVSKLLDRTLSIVSFCLVLKKRHRRLSLLKF
jgi:hypothetical protein